MYEEKHYKNISYFLKNEQINTIWWMTCTQVVDSITHTENSVGMLLTLVWREQSIATWILCDYIMVQLSWKTGGSFSPNDSNTREMPMD